MKKLIFILPFLLILYGAKAPVKKAIPDHFDVKVDPLNIDYSLLADALVYQLDEFRVKRRMKPLIFNENLKDILQDYVDRYQVRGIENRTKVKNYVHATYYRKSRDREFPYSWYGVGFSQRFGMKFYGSNAYFFYKKSDKKENYFFYGNRPLRVTAEELNRPIMKETYWLLARSMLRRSTIGPRSRGVYKKQMKEWAFIIQASPNNSRRKIPEVQLYWITVGKLTDRLRPK